MLSFCGRVEVEAVVTVMVGGRSRGAGTGGTEAAAGGGVTRGTGAGKGLDPWARPPVRMLQRLSEELLRPDWLLASLPLSCWSRYVSWADSVLLCAVTEMRGLDVPRGGTGGGAFLPLTAKQRREKKDRGKQRSALQTSWHIERAVCQTQRHKNKQTWTLCWFLPLSDNAKSYICISCSFRAPLTSFCLHGLSSSWRTFNRVSQGTLNQATRKHKHRT